MKAYRTHATITSPKKLVLKDLPFKRGEHVEVLLLGRDADQEAATEEFKALLRETQSLHQVKTIGEAQIAEEAAAYRVGR